MSANESIENSKNSNLKEKLKNIPQKPGIYIYKDKNNKVIYVGKAKNLRKRVFQYFRRNKGATHDDILYGEKIRRLVGEIYDIDFIITENEKEALILENEMIKKYSPQYNVLLKDDKSYPWIMITYEEDYPRILIVRQPARYYHAAERTKNHFLGPFINAHSLRETLKLLRKYFPYCSCKSPPRNRQRPCLYYQLKLCPAPCTKPVDKSEYLKNIKNIERIMSGDIQGLIENFKNEMVRASKELKYEDAARFRDIIKMLERLTEKQAIINYSGVKYGALNLDIFGILITLRLIGIIILHIRNGKLGAKTPFLIDMNKKIGDPLEILLSFLEQYYMEKYIQDLGDNNKQNSEIASVPSINGGNTDTNGVIKVPEYIILPSKIFTEINPTTETKIERDKAVVRIDFDRFKIKANTLEKILNERIAGGTQNREDIENNGNGYQKENDNPNKRISIITDNNKDLADKFESRSFIEYIKQLGKIADKNVSLLIRLQNQYKKLIPGSDVIIAGSNSDALEGNNASVGATGSNQEYDVNLIALKEIKDLLGLKELPTIIEGFDVSNWQQKDATAAMVCFINGKPAKSNYRSYKIRNKELKGDYDMMKEVIRRRYKRVIKENIPLPNLIVVDGGKIQVGAAREELKALNLEIPVIGLKKNKNHKTIDEIVLDIFDTELEDMDMNDKIKSGTKIKYKTIDLKSYKIDSEGNRLLQKISEEYHRRAIALHKKQMHKRVLRSNLDDIPGIGPKTKKIILDNFKDFTKIKEATIDDFQKILGEKRGAKIYKNLHEFLQNQAKENEQNEF
ncbi:MAG: excinuclease ABC subunit UvrC [Promethearchaeota archaeon]